MGKIQDWKPLPFSENLELIMYGGERDGVIYGYELAQEAHMPKIDNGYYMFEDRHSESRAVQMIPVCLTEHHLIFS